MAARRRGIGAIDKGKIDKAKFAAKGTEIADLQLSHVLANTLYHWLTIMIDNWAIRYF
jgi:hypothetical protein